MALPSGCFAEQVRLLHASRYVCIQCLQDTPLKANARRLAALMPACEGIMLLVWLQGDCLATEGLQAGHAQLGTRPRGSEIHVQLCVSGDAGALVEQSCVCLSPVLLRQQVKACKDSKAVRQWRSPPGKSVSYRLLEHFPGLLQAKIRRQDTQPMTMWQLITLQHTHLATAHSFCAKVLSDSARAKQHSSYH